MLQRPPPLPRYLLQAVSPARFFEARLNQGRLMMLGRFHALLSRFTARTLLPVLVLSLLADRALSNETVKERIAIFDVTRFWSVALLTEVYSLKACSESGKLWVLSGLYGKSFVERWDWPLAESDGDSGTDRARLELPDTVFAEGLVAHNGELFLLSWKSQKMFTIDPNRLEITKRYPLPGEGWGVTSDGENLWISDGTPRIRKWRDGTFQQPLSVTLRGKPLPRLNELEWIDGEIWANVWLTDQIVIISPTTGRITGIVDLTNLLTQHERERNTDVLNGIAQDQRQETYG